VLSYSVIRQLIPINDNFTEYGEMVEVGKMDGVVPSRMVSVSASINLPLHHKVQKFSSGTGSLRWSWKKGHKTVVVW